jgi:hypothetical protein
MTKEDVKEDLIKRFRKLHFDEDSHTYTINGKVLTSTTTYIDKFSQEFNSYYASENKARKIIQANPNDKRTAQYYRKRWDYINKEATNMGSRIHMFAECYPNFDEPICNGEQGVMDFFNWIPEHYQLLFLEFRLYDESTLRAGTIDGLLLNTKTNKLVIFDFKTNKRNILEYYTGKKLKDPFGDLYSTNLNKYSLQLSDYMWMIEKNTNYKVEERWIIWLKEGSPDKKCRDRGDAYKIDKVKPSYNRKFFKLFKVRDYSKQLMNDNTVIVEGLPDRKKDRKKKK